MKTLTVRCCLLATLAGTCCGVACAGSNGSGSVPQGGASASAGDGNSTGGQVSGSSGGSGGANAGGGSARAGSNAASGGSGSSNASGGKASGGSGNSNASGGKASGGGTGGGTVSRGGATSHAGSAGAPTSAAQPYKGVANSACADLTRLNVSWWYNWTTTAGSCKTAEFVPMISGKNEKTAAAVSSAITNIANAGYETVLGFNEPNKTDQANMPVAKVLELWPSLSQNAELRVGGPATSADAKAWSSDFMTAISSQGLRVDFVAVHWYGWNAGSCDPKAAELESYLKWAEGIAGSRPIWITEWGCMNKSNPDTATVEAFLQGALTMLAKHPRVERYAWYPWNTNNELVGADGSLTTLGTIFANAPATR